MALAWRVAWVTGASSGIGKEVARQLATSGVKVAVSSRSKPAGLDHENIHYIPLDVSDVEAVEHCVDEIEQKLGTVDLAIFSAAVYQPFDAASLSNQHFSTLTKTNFLGVTNCISAIAKRMMQRRRGHISWFASVAGYRGLPKAAYYAPTKAALINLAECLKLDLEPFGLTISVINPGFVQTPMTSVNDFKMPFLLTPEVAAQKTIQGLARRKFEVAYPWAFVYILKTLRLLPYWLYFAITRRTRSEGN